MERRTAWRRRIESRREPRSVPRGRGPQEGSGEAIEWTLVDPQSDRLRRSSAQLSADLGGSRPSLFRIRGAAMHRRDSARFPARARGSPQSKECPGSPRRRIGNPMRGDRWRRRNRPHRVVRPGSGRRGEEAGVIQPAILVGCSGSTGFRRSARIARLGGGSRAISSGPSA